MRPKLEIIVGLAFCFGCAPIRGTATKPSRERPVSSQKDITYAERQLRTANRLFIAALESPIKLRVYEVRDHTRMLIFEYEVRDYNPTIDPSDFLVTDPRQTGKHGIAWKYCKAHFCPIRSGAILYDVIDKTLFELAYEEDKGFVLSSNLAEPPNQKVKDWLLNWWREWPGNNADLKKIPLSYSSKAPR